MISQWDAQTAIYSALKGDTTFLAKGWPVHDGAVPQAVEPRFPYVVIGEASENGADLLVRIGRELVVTIHVFSRYKGSREVKEIMNEISRVLDRTVLTTSTWRFPVVRFESAQSMIEDEDQRHGVLNIRLTAQPV